MHWVKDWIDVTLPRPGPILRYYFCAHFKTVVALCFILYQTRTSLWWVLHVITVISTTEIQKIVLKNISHQTFIYNIIKSRKPVSICHRLEKFLIYSSRAVTACSPLGIILLKQSNRLICGRGVNECTTLKQAQGGCRVAEQCTLVAFGYKEENRDSLNSAA